MEIDPILKTKVIYYCEKVLNTKKKGDFLLWPTYSKIIGMSSSEVSDIVEVLQKEKIFSWKFVIRSVPAIDAYGEELTGLREDVEDHNFIVNEKLLKSYLLELKHGLREPSLKRDEIVRIASQIRTLFSKDKFVQVISNFHSSDEVYRYLENKKYSLEDLLLDYSYSKENLLPTGLSEFLNPIYYDINSEKSPKDLFNFIDNVFSTYGSKKDINEWKQKSSKYINNHKENDKSDSRIIFYIKRGTLQINNVDITVGAETIERTLLECTIDSYPDEISWDVVSEKDDGIKDKNSRKIRDAKTRINEKINKMTEIKTDLINGRKGNYKLTKKVTKR